jgi:hypothetical protein
MQAMEVISVDFLIGFLIQFGQALLEMVLTELIERLLSDRNSNPSEQDTDS